MTANSDATIQGSFWAKVAKDRVSSHSTWAMPVYEAMLAGLKLEPGSRIVDAGCGSGDGCLIFEKAGMQACGFDPASTMISITKERLPNGEFVVAGMESIPWNDDSFDGITSVNSFHFSEAPPRAARELYRVLRPGRRLAIHCFGPREGVLLMQSVFTAMLALVPEERKTESPFTDPFRLASVGVVDMLLKDAGFVDVVDEYVDAPVHFGSVEDGVKGLLNTALALAVSEVGGQEATRQAIASILEQGCDAEGKVTLPCRGRIVYGTKPA